MEINFGQKILTIRGKEQKDGEGDLITLGSICVNALLAMTDKKLTGMEKQKRGDLAEKIYKNRNDSLELKIEQVAQLKELVGEVYDPWTVKVALDMLDPQEKPSEE